MYHNYAELSVVIKGQGLQPIFRATNYGSALAFRSNNALRTYKGSKVYAVEKRSERKEPTGWLLPESI
jgi:hypothetical protein